jgi:hypothetical protein
MSTRDVCIAGWSLRWQRGDLATACTAAHEIPCLDLAHALAIVVLMAARQHARFSVPARTWVARLALEQRVDDAIDAAALSLSYRSGGRTCLPGWLKPHCRWMPDATGRCAPPPENEREF